MSIILTKKQEEGLKICLDRYYRGYKYTTISGYAGTGKSTLVKFLIQALPVDEDDVVYCAFTGKAAQVLMSKGNQNACTLHKLLYESIPRPDGTFLRRPVHDIYYKVVVVDEVSMVPKEMIERLLRYDAYVIFLGDPFQLPPIDKNSDNHLLDTPHIFLDEIMRQALDSEIIQLTLAIREGKQILPYEGKEVKIFDAKDLNTGMLIWADQIICATNKTRVEVNTEMRELLGRGKKPEDGDKVICLRNYWDYWADNGDYLVNGTIGYIDNSYVTFHQVPPFFGGQCVNVLNANFKSEECADYGTLNMDMKQILTGDKTLDPKTIYRLMRSKKFSSLVPMEFTYAYAITCHKAQGSQWNDVLVMEEGFPFNKEEHARWLYTACTRAIDRLVLIQ